MLLDDFFDCIYCGVPVFLYNICSRCQDDYDEDNADLDRCGICGDLTNSPTLTCTTCDPSLIDLTDQ